MLDRLFDGSLQLNRINYAHVVLIPKKGEASKVGDFRPINLLNDLLKIILKVLANRLREVLLFGERVEDHQSGFLKGRSSMDSIVTAQEVIQFTKRNRISRYMLKLDFEKAYDTVD